MQQASAIVGTCGLCLAENINLCYSDLLPKAVVRWIRMAAEPDQRNPNPVFVTPNLSQQISYRVAEYLLCPTCEDMLNKRGESWTLRNSYRGGHEFPLRAALSGVTPTYTLTQAEIIDARTVRGIDISKIVYFAVSVFWKASARRWRAMDHATQLDFGPYEKSFRKFLLGEQRFPDQAAMIVSVSGNPSPHTGAIYPYGGGRINGTRQYRFAIPGMAFWLHLGRITETLRVVCAYNAGSLCLAPDLNEMYVRDMGALIARFDKSGKRVNPMRTLP